MKRIVILTLTLLLLTGCAAQQTFETISDDPAQQVSVTARQVLLELPESASVVTIANQNTGKLYLCDGYVVTVQTLLGGDLNRTLQDVTGFTRDKLQLIQTEQAGVKRYSCVWATTGEGEDQICRACILDDGNFHYVVTVMAGADTISQLNDQWQQMMASFSLSQ